MSATRLALLLLWPCVPGVTDLACAAPPRAPQAGVVLAKASVSMDQAVRMVEQRYHARVIKAQAQKDDGHTVYVLKLLNDSGEVHTVRVDAASGEVL
jgi:uncharacterized membrane protein YkoI